MYIPLLIANYFIDKANAYVGDVAEMQNMDPMKLVKIVYVAHGWYLSCVNKPLITQNVEAWQYGPVIPNVYHEFKRYGGKNITLISPNAGSNKIKEEHEPFLDLIFNIYGKCNGLQLSTMTHYEGTPWMQTSNGIFQTPIYNEVIRSFYLAKEKIEDWDKGL